MVQFGDRLRALRTGKGLSQMDFAKQIRISKSSVNMYERGEREPSFETLEAIADYFNVDMDYLLGKSETIKKYPISPTATPATDLSRTELGLIQDFRALNAEGQQKLLEYVADLHASGRYIKTVSDNPLPKQA